MCFEEQQRQESGNGEEQGADDDDGDQGPEDEASEKEPDDQPAPLPSCATICDWIVHPDDLYSKYTCHNLKCPSDGPLVSCEYCMDEEPKECPTECPLCHGHWMCVCLTQGT